MAINAIERIKFGLFGRSSRVARVSDVDSNGQVHTLHFMGAVKERDNSLVQNFDATGWEKDPEASLINLIDERGVETIGYVVSPGGKTVNLFVEKPTGPNLEKVIGAAATMDDIAENMDLEKSMRKFYLGFAFGMIPGYIILSTIFNAMMTMTG